MSKDHLALDPGPPIPRAEIPRILNYVAGHDGRITATEATADIWARSVTGLGGHLVKDIIQAYYAKHDRINPDKQPINPGWIKTEANTRIERAQNLAKLPPPKRNGGPPPHVAQKFAEFKARQGFKSQIGEQG